MGQDVFDLVDKLWSGEASIVDSHPVTQAGTLTEVGPRCAFVPSFANVSAFSTDDGLVLVDTGSQFLARVVHSQIRQWNDTRLHSAVYSHGHIDHVFGVAVFEEEARSRGWEMPKVISHEALPRRFERYIATAGYNSVINQRQFGLADFQWPTDYRFPDETYNDTLEFEVGGEKFVLNHAKGETDDHTWTWIPDSKTICCGDLFIWASPNAGNPQKVQRYPREWAAALRLMCSLEPEILLPGHGFPIRGAQRVFQALTDTADLLDSLVDQSLVFMNQGARLDELIHSVKVPDSLLDKPYLQPVYDDPEFIVRNIWRLYGGWYDGNPATLKPASEAELAGEIAELAGGARRLADRALELLEAGNFRLAGHLAELACQAQPDDPGLHKVRATVFAERAAIESSTMAKGIFGWAATESGTHAGRD